MAAAWLATGRTLDHCSLLLSLLALAAAFCSEPPLLARAALLLAVLLGVGEKIYAIRVAFDERIFSTWATSWPATGDFVADAALAEFDGLLVRLGLRSQQPTQHSLDERIAGACALLRRQAICLALQLLAVLGAAFFLSTQTGLPHGA
ncbi:MAG: hypothetical protein CVU34_16225 [Betaproteobacteria bacterium HGW-Betaproteobacteria-7]|nr:MAG: hypothetical protein CVU34_16225 [Betaproteobacteria bacterium HGW-Betaproteobacteria-7]